MKTKRQPLILILYLFFIAATKVFAGSPVTNVYWQQRVNYDIDVTLNDADNTLHAFEKVEYINNSPDTLGYIWFHIWPNAYKDETSAFYKQLTILKERKDKMKRF